MTSQNASARESLATFRKRPNCQSGFTLVETMISLVLVFGLIIATWSALYALQRATRDVADHVSALGLVQGKMERLRAVDYSPPSPPFTIGTTNMTEPVSMSLNHKGTKLLAHGTLDTELKLLSSGHLVTITATFTNLGTLFRSSAIGHQRVYRRPKMKISHDRRRSSQRPEEAFTLTELLFVTGITSVIVAGFMTFTSLTSRLILEISTQTTINSEASIFTERLQTRTPYAVGISNNADGTRLTLAFDDDPDLDSNNDGVAYNDTNHIEAFVFVDRDKNPDTHADNRIDYLSDITRPDASVTLLSSGVRPILNSNLFHVTPGGHAYINVGVIAPSQGDQSQLIEIRTTVLARNTQN